MLWLSVTLAVVGLIAVVLGAVLGWAVFPPLVEEKIGESVELAPNTDQYERWESLPFAMMFKVYIWNVTNPEEVQNGGKPIMQEIGPYIYNQRRQKFNITRNNGVLSYYERQMYDFNAEASAPLDQNDEITVLHIPFHAVAQQTDIETGAQIGLVLLNQNYKKIFETNTPFLETKVRTLLFDGVRLCQTGSTATICNAVKARNSKTMRVEEDGIYFSLFNHKNFSHDGYYEVKSGVGEPSQVGQIVRWENQDKLDIWPEYGQNDTICNMINGSDASIYTPFVSKNDIVQIFNTDICRSVTLRYHRENEYKGIKNYEFRAFEDMLPAPSEADGTMCFCINITTGITQENGCLRKGAMELYKCQDAHLVLTFPHFLMADEDYQNGVEGMHPDPDLHQTTLELEPNTGSPLRGGKRVQFNMFLRPVRLLTVMKNVKTTLFPVVWVDEGVELPDDLIDMLNEQLFDVLETLEIVKWTLIGVGAGLVAISFVYFMMTRKKATAV